MRRFHSQSGNTLITVLLAMGLSSIVIFTLANVFSDAFKNQRSISQSVAAEQEASLLLVALSRPETCTQALLKDAAGNLLSARTPSKVKVGIDYKEIRMPDISGGTTILTRAYSASDCKSSANEVICNNLHLSAIKLGPKKKTDGTVFAQLTPDFMLGEVALTFKKGNQTSGPDFITRTVPIGLTVDSSTGRIVSCQSGGGDINSGFVDPPSNCSASVYKSKPWIKEKIFCQTPGGTLAILYYAGDGLIGSEGTAIYSSPHGQSPLNIWYSSANGKYVKHDGSATQDGGTCINQNLKDITKDAFNTCQ